jgi:hypothetical protein
VELGEDLMTFLYPPSDYEDTYDMEERRRQELERSKREILKTIDIEYTKIQFCRRSDDFEHKWINASFMNVNLVCKYCDLSKSKHDSKIKELEATKKLYE